MLLTCSFLKKDTKVSKSQRTHAFPVSVEKILPIPTEILSKLKRFFKPWKLWCLFSKTNLLK